MNKKTMRWLYLGAVALAVLTALAVLGLYGLRCRIEKDPLAQYQILEEGQTKFAWQVEECRLENGKLTVAGWLVEPGRQYDVRDGEITAAWNCTWAALVDEEAGTVYRMPTQARMPEGGDPYPQDGIDHKNCGFFSRANALDGGEKLYLAVKTYSDGWYLVPTGMVICE